MKQYIVDTFTTRLFGGNQAAVCMLDKWLSDERMLNIAKENNFSETAFCVKSDNCYKLRWFTPKNEIDLCGHATLATAFVIKNYVDKDSKLIIFDTLSGQITVKVSDDMFEMTFPAYKLNAVDVTDKMEEALGIRPKEAYLDRDLLMVLDRESDVKDLSPNFDLLKELDGLCVAVTAKSEKYDCISRVFAPELSIPEDPVTGSTHCMIAPYWAKKLGKNTINAFQASERQGELICEVLDNNKVKISGKAVLFGIIEIFLPEI